MRLLEADIQFHSESSSHLQHIQHIMESHQVSAEEIETAQSDCCSMSNKKHRRNKQLQAICPEKGSSDPREKTQGNNGTYPQELQRKNGG